MKDCVGIIINGRIVILVEHSFVNQLLDSLKGKVRVHRTGSISEKCSKVMHFSRLTAFQDQGNRSTFLCLDQMLMHCGYCQQRRNRHMVFIHTAVRQNDDIRSVTVSTVCFNK